MWHKCICLHILYFIYRASVFPLIPGSIRFSFGTNAVYGTKKVSQPEWSRDRKWLCFPAHDVQMWKKKKQDGADGEEEGGDDEGESELNQEPAEWCGTKIVQLISLTANRAVHRFPISTF